MARGQRSSIPAELRSLFPTRWLNAKAREVGLVERRRKVAPAAFFWSVVLGFGTGHRRSIASLRKFFGATTGVALVPSSFYDWFNDHTVRFLRAALGRAIERTAQPAGPLRDHLARFKDVCAADATLIRLRDALQRAYKACRTNHTRAAMKLHLVMSVVGAGPRSVAITGERVNERRRLTVGPWVRGRLLLFDLGYFKWHLFERIKKNGGYFVSRLRDDANPLIIGENRRWRGASRHLRGRRLGEVKDRLAREVVDLMVQVDFERRAYLGRKTRERAYFREVAKTYAARWEIELVFRELKSHLRMTQLASAKRAVVETLVYAALIGLAVSRSIWRSLRARTDAARRVSERRVTDALATIAGDLVAALLGEVPDAAQLRKWHRLLSREALDPNVGRTTLKRGWAC